MSHPDDGTIQMLLDGELDAEQQSRIEHHMSACANCSARLAEARAFQLEADRLVEMLAIPSPTAGRLDGRRGRNVIRSLAWAASIVVAVSLGYWGRGMNSPTADVPQEGDVLPRASVTPPAAAPASPSEMDSVPPATSVARIAPATDALTNSDDAAGARSAERAPREERDEAPRREAKAADRVDAPERVVGQAAAAPPPAAEQEARQSRANLDAAKVGRSAEVPAVTWRVISMEEAVRLLGGQLRLIDGLAPDRVETGPGTAVVGADPSRPLVRVVYASGTVTLDQQRPGTAISARRDAAAPAAGAVAPGSVTGWQERSGIRFVVTGGVSADTLRALAARVH